MNKVITFVLGCSVLTTLGCTSSTTIENNAQLLADSEKQECLNDAKQAPSFQDLLDQKWDYKQVGCGAVQAYIEASESYVNPELVLHALGAQITYMTVLNKEYPKLYKAGQLTESLNARWNATRHRADHLIQAIDSWDSLLPEVALLKGIYYLTETLQDATTKQQLASMPKAKELVFDSVERDIDVLDGLGAAVKAQLYVDLPSFVGGNLQAGIELYEETLKKYPNDLELLVKLVKAYDAKGDRQVQAQLIKRSTEIVDNKINTQDLADSLLFLGGVSARLGLIDEGNKIRTERNALIKQHPYLLLRKSKMELGHGGNDPITGEDPNAI